MSDKVKGILNYLARIGLSALLLWFIFSKIDVEATKAVLIEANLSILFLALLVFFFINIILLFRWYAFICAIGIKARMWDIVRNHLIGLFGNLFLPSSVGGDLLKTMGLCKGSDQKTKIVASVLLDRLSGFAAIVLISVPSFIIGYKYINDLSVLAAIVIMTVASLIIALILFNEKVYSFCCYIFKPFPKIEKTLMNLHYDIALVKDKKKESFIAIGISCISQTIFACMWFVIAKALNQDIGLLYFIIFVPLTNIASSVPSIGGLGVREVGAAFLFAKIGVDSGVAVSISLMCYVFMVIVGSLGGLIYVFTLSSGRLQHHSSDAEQTASGA